MSEWKPKEIEEFRKAHNLTRKALGELLGGLAVTTIFKWERGERNPSKATKLLLSRIEKDLKKRGGVKNGKNKRTL
jgi:DNA-binding transcriptional regulator YiaG